ncbi:unnamed protein product [Ranitomeya imitator]|uniref:UPAR/Ly6 domain-containing protein n=1 Tax=Ranitomeya imitator TaxID=111125 RepID=A0ABN9KYY8_9NEOB|nr:unnamed protein product [Ranitomeya imitator]
MEIAAAIFLKPREAERSICARAASGKWPPPPITRGFTRLCCIPGLLHHHTGERDPAYCASSAATPPQPHLCHRTSATALLPPRETSAVILSIAVQLRGGPPEHCSVSCQASLTLPISVIDAEWSSGLQCYSCNIISGARYIDKGCTSPEVVACSPSHKGFKQRFCIKTESVVLGKPLSSGCATSRHCQQQELPGVRIHCCDTDLCNAAVHPPSLGLHLLLCFLGTICYLL